MSRASRDRDRLLAQVVRTHERNSPLKQPRKASLVSSLSTDIAPRRNSIRSGVSNDSHNSRPSSGPRTIGQRTSAVSGNGDRPKSKGLLKKQSKESDIRNASVIPLKQTSVELPPISKTGLILEDADDVDYSISTNGGRKSERSPIGLSLADSCKQIGKHPNTIVDRASYNSFARKQNVLQKDEISQRKPRQFNTVVTRLSSAKNSRNRVDTAAKAEEERFKRARYVQLKPKLPLAATSTNNVDEKSNNTEIKNSSASNSDELTLPGTICDRNRQLKEEKEESTTPLQRCITAKRKQKNSSGRGDDFVVEIFLNKTEKPSKTVINEIEKENSQLIEKETRGLKFVPAAPSTSENIATEQKQPLDENKVVTQEDKTQDPNSLNTTTEPDEASESDRALTGESDKREDTASVEVAKPVQPVVSSAEAFYRKYEEDTIMQAEDVFILGLELKNESKKFESSPITVQEAISLKRLLFGDVGACWCKSWLNHPVSMSGAFSIDLCHLSPSGIVAALQAHYLHQHFFAASSTPPDGATLWRPTQQQKQRNLARAVANMLSQCAGAQNGALIFCSASTSVQYKASTNIPHDGITERIQKFMFSNVEEMDDFLDIYLPKLIGCKYFLVLLLYSVLLTRSPYNVRQDTLNSEEPLLTESGSRCSPTLMSLLVTGVAAPSWLNDSVHLRNELHTRRGIATRVPLGLLTCRQTKRNILVESNMKTPKLPIWIAEVNAWPNPKLTGSTSRSGTRYTVVFCSNRRLISDWKVERHFDLHWLLACPFQVEKVKLTIDARTEVSWGDLTEDDFHSIETAIRTKWTDIEVDWNGADPSDFGFLPTSQNAVEQFKRM